MIRSSIDPAYFYIGTTIGDLLAMDIRSGETVKSFRGHKAPVMDIVEDANRKRVISAGDDKALMIFDILKFLYKFLL